MALESAMVTNMTIAIHNALGQTVTYVSADDEAVSGKVILNISSELFPGIFESNTAEVEITARVLRSLVETPRRSDVLIDASDNRYTVDSVSELNESEWALELRRC